MSRNSRAKRLAKAKHRDAFSAYPREKGLEQLFKNFDPYEHMQETPFMSYITLLAAHQAEYPNRTAR